MARVKIIFPAGEPAFSCTLPVRITDINYGNHLGNDALLSILHEARVQFLKSHEYTELNAGGVSLIMGDVMIAYRGEAFYGDELLVKLYISELSSRAFDILYHVSTVDKEIAHAKTGMVCYDYNLRKVVPMTEKLRKKLEGMVF
jgi:acyl-CoA thioester hydrolase